MTQNNNKMKRRYFSYFMRQFMKFRFTIVMVDIYSIRELSIKYYSNISVKEAKEIWQMKKECTPFTNRKQTIHAHCIGIGIHWKAPNEKFKYKHMVSNTRTWFDASFVASLSSCLSCCVGYYRRVGLESCQSIGWCRS